MASFDSNALQKITDAVAAAEKGTAGEIVVVVAERSGTYVGARAAIALAITTLVAFAAALLDADATWVALGFPIVFVATMAVTGVGAVARAIVPRGALEAEALRGARVAFVARGVHQTKDRCGVLVYLSLLEHCVYVVGDAGIHDVVGGDGWKAYVGRIVGAMKAGQLEGVAAVVADIGAVLGRHFPRAADDKNELPDAVVVQRG